MATDKALYWIAICLMAVGLGNSFVNHHRDFTRNLGLRAMIVADTISGRTQGQIDRANVFFDRTQAGFDRSQAAVDRVQTRVACLQTRIAQRQAALARAQAVRTRMAVAQSVRNIVVTVPEIPSKTIVVAGWDDDSEQ
jgi:hypothetical protein